MAIIASTFGTSSVSKLYRDADADNTVEEVTTSSITMQQIMINNSTNAAEDVWLHMWNLNSAPTFGTAGAHMILYCPRATVKHYVFPTDVTFATGLYIACTKTAGNVTWTEANPTNAVAVAIYTAA